MNGTSQAKDPTQRFSGRVENYIQYRPTYPRQILEILVADCGLDTGSVFADAGSGTGILARLSLENGNPVFGVEPNPEMRQAGERLLSAYPRFTSLPGTAEQTGLPNHSVDFVTAGQAFHWFDPGLARREFLRILRPGGWVVLTWNTRRTDTTPFLRAYERLLLAYAADYRQVTHRQIDLDDIRRFYGTEEVALKTLENHQEFDLQGFKGRAFSSSYVLFPGHPQHASFLAGLEAIFVAHQAGGKVVFEYETQLYYARLRACVVD